MLEIISPIRKLLALECHKSMAGKTYSLKLSRLPKLLTLAVAIWLVLTAMQIIWNNYKYQQFKQRQKTAIIKPVKVFQIGFSKCGTVAINSFFNQNGIPSVHHDGGFLPTSIHENYLNGIPLISEKYSEILVFTDMEVLYNEPQIIVGMMYFKELDKQYPGSKFIFNTRNKQAWLKSRSLQNILPSNDPLLKVSSEILKISQDEMLARWSREWDEHNTAVLEYFKNRPNDLLVFDIEKDNPQKMVAFFKENFHLNANYYEKKNTTAFRGLREWYDKIFSDKSMVVIDSSVELSSLPNPTIG